MPPMLPLTPPARVRGVAATTLALACVLGAPATRADALEGLSPENREAVVSACLPAQYRGGADAYRRCVEGKATAVAERDPGALELLELDERYAVERRCAEARAASELEGLSCIDAEIASLVGAPVPRLDGLREDERHALLRGCFETQSGAGVAAWRECMVDAADALRDVPAVDVSSLGVVERNALQAGCAAERDGADYRRCLLERGPAMGATRSPDALSSSTRPPPSSSSSASPSSSSPSPSTPTLGRPAPASPAASSPEPRRESISAVQRPAVEPASEPASEPALGTALTEASRTGASDATESTTVSEPAAAPRPPPNGAASETVDVADAREVRLAEAPATEEPPAAAPESGEGGILGRLGETWDGLDRTGQLLLWGALALPLLLLASAALLRRGRGGTARHAAADGASARERGTARSSAARQRPRRRPVSGAASGALADRIGPTRGRPMSDDTSDDHMEPPRSDDPHDPHDPHDVFDAPGRRAPARTADARERLSTEADDLFDALDRDLDDGHDASFDEAAREPGRDPDADGTTASKTPGPDRDAPTVLLGSPASMPPPSSRPTSAPPRVIDGGDDDALPDVQRAVRRRDAEPAYGPDDASSSGPRAAEPPAAARPVRPDFSAWLASRPEHARRGLAIEFLVYWIAWGDERYDPATREVVFADADPDDGTLVKRAVLDEDVEAFAATVRWLVLNTSREARAQILELLVALLVADPWPTPVQNTLLRFLADVFGLGGEALEALFEAGFDAPMPPLPRVDRPDWWAVQDEAGLVRREARTLARSPATMRYRARLGLPLDGELAEADVLAAFELAARRCDPERFDALGERERTLAARQLERFVDARTALLRETA